MLNVDPIEVAKFAQHATEWWDIDGPLKTLHDLNPARIQLVERFVPLARKKVLDVGCGGGIFAEAMHNLGAIVTGIDIEPNAIAAAKAHALSQDAVINYSCEDIACYNGEKADVVTCMEMLEHVPDPAAMVQQLAAHVVLGGYVFMSTINRTPLAYVSVILAAEYILHLLPRQTHDYKKFIKPAELAAMARAAGLEVVAIVGLGYNPLTRKSSIVSSVQANYILVCRQDIS